jgi:hypothetical protein
LLERQSTWKQLHERVSFNVVSLLTVSKYSRTGCLPHTYPHYRQNFYIGAGEIEDESAFQKQNMPFNEHEAAGGQFLLRWL